METNTIFDIIFDRFDLDKIGKVSIRKFIDFMNELEKLRRNDSEPIFDDISRKQVEEFISENQSLEVNRNDLFVFIESLIGKKMELIAEESLISCKKSVINTDLSSRSRSAPLEVSALQHQKPRCFSSKDYIELSNIKEKSSLNNDSIMPESFNISPVSHSTPNKRQLNDISFSGFLKPSSQNLLSDIYRDNFVGSDFVLPKIDDSLEKEIVLEGFGSSPSSVLRKDISESSFEKSPQALQKDENILFLTDLVRKYKDSERQTNALIIRHEQHIDELESKIESVCLELKDKKKELFETSSREKNLFNQVSVLEKELEKQQKELRSWEDKYLNMKTNCEEQLNEVERVKNTIKEKEKEIEKSQQLIKDLREGKDSLEVERYFFSDKISALKEQYQELELKNQELNEYKFENIRLNEIIEKLNSELDEIKRNKLKEDLLEYTTTNIERVNPMNLENELLSTLQNDKIEADQNLVLNARQPFIDTFETLNKGVQVNTLQETNIDLEHENNNCLNLNVSSKTEYINDKSLQNFQEINNQYDLLSREINTQNHLIEKLFQHRFKIFKKNESKNNLKINNFLFFILFFKSLNWIILVLCICIILSIGAWMTNQNWFVLFREKPQGITYAELNAWKRANSLDYKLYQNGIIGSGRLWLEGNWRWINCLEWWIDNLLRDVNIQWPS
ncbi:hypothetical protein PNEG_03464 [Pneumocystis murina B123]|uniref:EF-hand domain-containing protein n=1 Tax=Pneumocystis murina (strain B123) TaxID=1069680 RepID=M7NLE8_PNEMU|nr:hypothetical protein PNEG_03464 [Pneumocystis murina B123]EMR08022.1 hypothetical protein PNEG_03464 [Pneumocystis murina B123]